MNRTLFTNADVFIPEGRFVRGSLLVEQGTIMSVLPAGENTTNAEIVDLHGGNLLPGFVDAHVHLLELALRELQCDLSGARSADDAVERLARWAREHENDRPVMGVDWDESTWNERTMPTRAMLDAIDPHRPIFARRVCLHVGVANSALLNMLSASRQFVDADTGRVTEAAAAEATRRLDPPPAEIPATIESAIGRLHSLGVTAVHDIVDVNALSPYLEGVRRSKVPLRIDALFITGPESFAHVRESCAGLDPELFRPLGIKLFSDGSLSGRTAALHSCYADAHTIGEFLLDEDEFRGTLRRCVAEGITCAVHGIGDRAIRVVAMAMGLFPGEQDLFRIEHAELTGWEEVDLLRRVGVPLVLQPNFVRNWQQEGGLYESRLGRARARKCNRFRTLREAGVSYAFGSDGMPPGPLFGMRGATHHPVSSERLTLSQALLAYAAGGRMGRRPRALGEIAPGRPADLVVLSGDPGSGDPDSLAVERTYLGGRLVYQRKAPAPAGESHLF